MARCYRSQIHELFFRRCDIAQFQRDAQVEVVPGKILPGIFRLCPRIRNVVISDEWSLRMKRGFLLDPEYDAGSASNALVTMLEVATASGRTLKSITAIHVPWNILDDRDQGKTVKQVMTKLSSLRLWIRCRHPPRAIMGLPDPSVTFPYKHFESLLQDATRVRELKLTLQVGESGSVDLARLVGHHT